MSVFFFFFFNDTATTEIYTLSLHDALPISHVGPRLHGCRAVGRELGIGHRSEEHTSELQSRQYLVCRLLLEKKNKDKQLAQDTRIVQHLTSGPTRGLSSTTQPVSHRETRST